jgi:hypothetical protein
VLTAGGRATAAQAHRAAAGGAVLPVPLATFAAISAGAVACALAGAASVGAGCGGPLPGSAVVAMVALAASGACCAAAPLYASLSPEAFLAFVLAWGAVVVADSAQFSALCAREVLPESSSCS